MPKQPEEKLLENKFEATFSVNIGKHLTIYMKNGKAMSGVLRAYNHNTASIDTPKGIVGGTQVDCSDISSVSVK